MIATSGTISWCTWSWRAVGGRRCVRLDSCGNHLVPVFHAVLRMFQMLKRVCTIWLLGNQVCGSVLLVLFTVHKWPRFEVFSSQRIISKRCSKYSSTLGCRFVNLLIFYACRKDVHYMYHSFEVRRIDPRYRTFLSNSSFTFCNMKKDRIFVDK